MATKAAPKVKSVGDVPTQSLQSARVPGHELSMALRRAYMRLHRDTCARCAEEDVTADQFVMMNVIKTVGRAKQSELVTIIDSDANTVSAMVRRLERRGLVQREAHRGDGRANLVSLTEAGVKLQAVLEKKTAKNRREMEAAFSASELSELIGLLKRLATM